MSNLVGDGISIGRKRRVYSPRAGWSGSDEYTGTLFNVNALATQFQRLGLGFELEYLDGNPYAKFITYATDADDGSPLEDQVVSVWGLVTNDLEKNITEAPEVLSLPAETVKDVLKRVATVNEDEDNFIIDVQALHGTALDLYVALVRGWPSSFFVPQYVLQNTVTLPRGVAIDAGYYQYAGVVMTNTANLVRVFAIPLNELSFDMPEGQWLVKGANTVPQDNGKAIFTQEYWHADQWPSFPYNRRV